MTPTQVVDAFDKACEGLQVSRQAHVVIQQITQGIRAAIARDDTTAAAQAASEAAAQKDEPQEE